MARILKPPNTLRWKPSVPAVFLAGSIDMGRAEPWQRLLEKALADTNAVILNPRRDDWDSSWEQSIHNSQFRKQVEWELKAQERADVIAMYLAPDSKAPITLLELGLAARSGKLIVCCPHGYWRKGNVDVVCRRYKIATVKNLDQLVRKIRHRLE